MGGGRVGWTIPTGEYVLRAVSEGTQAKAQGTQSIGCCAATHSSRHPVNSHLGSAE